MNKYYLGERFGGNKMEHDIIRMKIITKLFYDYLFYCDAIYELFFIQTLTHTKFRFNPDTRQESEYDIQIDFNGIIYISQPTNYTLITVTHREAKLTDYDDVSIYGSLGKEYLEDFCAWINKNCFQITKESEEV